VAGALAASSHDVFGNASSIHGVGQLARRKFEAARETIAAFLHASATELVFTSGGTESNNLAILGLARSLPGKRKHVVTTLIEHPSALEPFHQLEREGLEVSYARPDENGIVHAEEVRRHLRDHTVLVSVMHGNNEIGTIQPIAEISAMLRERAAAEQKIYLHSDGVQALGKIPVDVQDLGVDLYSVSAHKIFGPKGVGALFVRKGTPLRGIQLGGRHERERRAGTENVPGAMAFARALELCDDLAGANVVRVRDHFERRVMDAIDDVEINGAKDNRLPNTSNLLFHGVAGESMVIALDMKGMAVSSGSACSSGSTEPSHVLLAIGRTRDEAKSSVRFSFGRYNTMQEADQLADAVIASVRQLRTRAGRESQLVRA
jgi:cysteine desulfurase